MRSHHRVAALLVTLGVVVAGVLMATQSGASLNVPSKAPVSPLEAPRPTVSPTGATHAETYEEWQSRLAAEEQARQDAIAALNAAQAQALADQLAAAARRLQAAPGPAVQVAPPSSGDCFGVNQYAAYIYQRESGCNPGSVNGGGCAGIGQACPGSKMPCSLTDVQCQLAYFEAYALGRYGSWEAAYQFWIGHSWW